MEPEFWHQRWADNLIGFHQSQLNPHLRDFWPRLKPERGSTVFVPLCGKSLDMGWLRDQGYRVLGVEISPLAVEGFFRESGLTPQCEEQGGFRVYSAAGIDILCGDFFALQPQHVAGVKAAYDRASLIALPPEMREQYAGHLARLLAAEVPVLLITLDYPQTQMQGPPFSVDESEVRTLYQDDFHIELLCSSDILSQETRFAERGLSRLQETVYLMRRRAA